MTTLIRVDEVKGAGIGPPWLLRHAPEVGLPLQGGDMMNVFVAFIFLVLVVVDFLIQRVSVAVVLKIVTFSKDKEVLSLRSTRRDGGRAASSTGCGVRHQQRP